MEISRVVRRAPIPVSSWKNRARDYLRYQFLDPLKHVEIRKMGMRFEIVSVGMEDAFEDLVFFRRQNPAGDWKWVKLDAVLKLVRPKQPNISREEMEKVYDYLAGRISNCLTNEQEALISMVSPYEEREDLVQIDVHVKQLSS